MLPQSVEELADRLGLEPDALRGLAARASDLYRHYTVPKANGRPRAIAEPAEALKVVQRQVLDIVLNELPIHPAATAFQPGATVRDNAWRHRGQRFVFNCDLADFFPNLIQPRVAGLFGALGAPREVAALLASLTCCQGRLSQGAPTSPAIANRLAWKLDLRLTGYCERRDWTYSRYADDLTISGQSRFIERDRAWIFRCIRDEGFTVNPKKTHLALRHQAQRVTGLSLHQGGRLPRACRQRLRAMFHQASLDPAGWADRFHELQGHLGWLRHVEPANPHLARYEAVLPHRAVGGRAPGPGAPDNLRPAAGTEQA